MVFNKLGRKKLYGNQLRRTACMPSLRKDEISDFEIANFIYEMQQ
jgi:hypothetical protein